MQKAVTAVYRTHAAADLVRSQLAELGIPRGHVSVVPDDPARPAEGAHRDGSAYERDIHDLHLPEADARSYAEAVRRGDFVVSVNVDDDAHLPRIKEIMRHPEEAQDLDALERAHAGAEYRPYDYASDPYYKDDPHAARDPGAADMGAAATGVETGTTSGVEYDPERYRGTREEGADLLVRSYARRNPMAVRGGGIHH